MKNCELVFQGYTWDDYFHIIADKSGIMIVYKGGLDCEGAIKLDEIVFIGGSEKLNDLYESQDFYEVRRNINFGERFFYSYASTNREDRDDIVFALNEKILNSHRHKSTTGVDICLICRGACALFPEEFLSKES